MIIDATDLILGRFATVVAKKALKGEKIDIVNCENAIIVGQKKEIAARFKRKREMGAQLQGPYYPRYPHMIVKRAIRGMLPYKRETGKEALKRITCHIGVPTDLKDKKTEVVKEAVLGELKVPKYVHIKDISIMLGAKI